MITGAIQWNGYWDAAAYLQAVKEAAIRSSPKREIKFRSMATSLMLTDMSHSSTQSHLEVASAFSPSTWSLL